MKLLSPWRIIAVAFPKGLCWTAVALTTAACSITLRRWSSFA